MTERGDNGENAGRHVVACGIFRREMEALRPADRGVAVEYLDQSLHRTPERMTGAVQDAVDRAARHATLEIVLGYGLCSNGTVGVRAPEQGLLVPRIHDCIGLFLGSRKAYDRAFTKQPGTYYLTPGWIAEEKDPLGMLEGEYTARVGKEDAAWAIQEELKHYSHVALIDTRAGGDAKALRARAKDNARFLDKAYEEVPGSSAYFEKILFGPHDEGDFLRVDPGQSVAQEPFL